MNTRSSPRRARRLSKSLQDAVSPPKSPTSQKRRYEEEISTAQEQLLREPKFSDLTIVCGDRIWNCQRSILSQRCAFFRAACSGQFEESQTRCIELKEDSPEAIDIVLLHLYTLQVPDFTDKTLFPILFIAAQVYHTADKYDIVPLRTAAKERFVKVVSKDFEGWLSTSEIKRNWIAWVTTIWEWKMQGAEEVREAVVLALMKTAKSAIEDTDFQDLLRTNEDLNFALIRALATHGKQR